MNTGFGLREQPKVVIRAHLRQRPKSCLSQLNERKGSIPAESRLPLPKGGSSPHKRKDNARRFDGPMLFVPEGQHDRSQARSAWNHEENSPVPAGRLKSLN
jgi:hypothetical protein